MVHLTSKNAQMFVELPDGEWKEIGPVIDFEVTVARDLGYEIMGGYIDGLQAPTRWQRFCYRFRQFWLEPRWF